MASGNRDLRPIQVLLDTSRFIEHEEPKTFAGGSKDFFRGNDKGFVNHKAEIRSRLDGAALALRRRGEPGGFIRVQQREEALAKSHRPLGHLFTAPNKFALVGAEGVGELLFQVTPAALDSLSGIIESKAEPTPRRALNKRTGREEERASGYRSEVGGIEGIRLHGATDKVKFSAEQAIAWMSQPDVIGGYIVELFRPNRNVSPHAVEQLIQSLRAGFDEVPGGLLVRPFLPATPTTQFGDPTLALSIQLLTEPRRLVELPFLGDGRPAEIAESGLPTDMKGVRADLAIGRHADLLRFLADQALVRSVELPPRLQSLPAEPGAAFGPLRLPEPAADGDYPTVAVIDGGVSDNAGLGTWKVGDAGLVPLSDRDESHGTFIAGLISAGAALNPSLDGALEPRGCRVFDIDLFPRRELRGSYYGDLEELFDVLDEKVKVAKHQHNVRVFNLSFSIGPTRTSRLSYSLAADRLDRIARSNDVIFIVAAGNLGTGKCRPVWPEKAEEAVTMLAGFGTQEQQITPPSEHLLGITVGAVNPPGLPGHVALLPTTYTRRGPGVGGARKPDLAHIGGAEMGTTGISGLVSLTPAGDVVHNCGTSFATPLAAATIATLDHRLDRQAPRETLMALPIHRATRANALGKKPLRHVSREFVGFGVSPSADVILSDDPHSVTLVFSDRLQVKQRLEFPFAWPHSLVRPDGSCRGRAQVTLCYTPTIDPDHREESIRVQLEAFLHQEKVNPATRERSWESRLEHDASDVASSTSKSEIYLIKTGLKWSPIKRYEVSMPTGRGNTSNWRLSLESLLRAGVAFPVDGVQFTLLMTISDLKAKTPIREEMRLDLQNRGMVLADITVAHRIRQRRTN